MTNVANRADAINLINTEIKKVIAPDKLRSINLNHNINGSIKTIHTYSSDMSEAVLLSHFYWELIYFHP